MAVSTVTGAKASVPGKAKSRLSIITLTGTYTAGGEVLTLKQLGFGHRLTKSIASLAGGNGIEATPVGDCWVTNESGVIKLHLLNGKTSAELAGGVAVTGVRVEVESSGY